MAKRSTGNIIYTDENDEQHELPTRFEVCPSCQGHGTSSAYLGAWTASEWAQEDDEFKEDYLAGRYDRPCETCDGLRVVPLVDEEQCDPKLLKAYQDHQRELAEMRSVERQERLMEGGWRDMGWYGREY